jgi:hypothetical protein
MALGRTIIDGADEGSRRNLTRLQLPELKKGKNKPRPYRGVCYSRVCDLDQNESVLVRPQRKISDGVVPKPVNSVSCSSASFFSAYISA